MFCFSHVSTSSLPGQPYLLLCSRTFKIHFSCDTLLLYTFIICLIMYSALYLLDLPFTDINYQQSRCSAIKIPKKNPVYHDIIPLCPVFLLVSGTWQVEVQYIILYFSNPYVLQEWSDSADTMVRCSGSCTSADNSSFKDSQTGVALAQESIGVSLHVQGTWHAETSRVQHISVNDFHNASFLFLAAGVAYLVILWSVTWHKGKQM